MKLLASTNPHRRAISALVNAVSSRVRWLGGENPELERELPGSDAEPSIVRSPLANSWHGPSVPMVTHFARFLARRGSSGLPSFAPAPPP